MFRPDARDATIIGALIALKIALLFALAWNTRFVMDEFVQLGWAKYLGNGLFDTVWHAKAVGYVLFYKLAHLIGWDAQSILLLGRLQTALLGCATLAIMYSCARALGQDRARALLIILVLLCFSNFMERIFRTRAEPLAVFFAAAGLLVVLRGNADRALTLIVAGVLSGLAFLATQKAVYFNLALGVALFADAALARRFAAGALRGSFLVAGWAVPIAAYCVVFGGNDALAIARSLFLGPVEIATEGAAPYAGIRRYVIQTLARNPLLYGLCFAGMIAGLVRLPSFDERARIALIFTAMITALVFSHDQPWPYVFVMALPFMALWSLWIFDWSSGERRRLFAAKVVLGLAVLASFVSNLAYFRFDNRGQLQLVARAEALVQPHEIYFDGIAMLPNRSEPGILWLDRREVLATLEAGVDSEAYRIFSDSPPRVVLWSYRMDAIAPVIGSLFAKHYVKVAPNVRILGRRLAAGQPVRFNVPVAGTYALYSDSGQPIAGKVTINGRVVTAPFYLPLGEADIALLGGSQTALLLPQGYYAGLIGPGPDDEQLFANVYD